MPNGPATSGTRSTSSGWPTTRSSGRDSDDQGHGAPAQQIGRPCLKGVNFDVLAELRAVLQYCNKQKRREHCGTSASEKPAQPDLRATQMRDILAPWRS